jgi:hypothetical protein
VPTFLAFAFPHGRNSGRWKSGGRGCVLKVLSRKIFCRELFTARLGIFGGEGCSLAGCGPRDRFRRLLLLSSIQTSASSIVPPFQYISPISCLHYVD